jgi:hypothetical protein
MTMKKTLLGVGLGFVASPFIAVAAAVLGTVVVVAGATAPVWAPVAGGVLLPKLMPDDVPAQSSSRGEIADAINIVARPS